MADNKRVLHIGDRIEAKEPGKSGSKASWIKGTITAINSDGTYEILYDGVSLAKTEIRPAENPFSVDDTVSVSFRGKVAKINSDGTIDVKLGDSHVVKSVNQKHVHTTSGNVDAIAHAAVGGRGNPKEPHVPKFADSEKVEVDYNGKGKWLPGRISRVRKDGHYDVIYDDGDQEQNIPEADIREIPGTSKEKEIEFAVGTKIEARLKGKSRWFPGSITAVHEKDTFDVEYEDGEKEKSVAKNLIRIPRRTSLSGVSTPVFVDGEKIEANYKNKGKWYPGVVVKVHADGTIDIDYDDGEKEKKVDTKLIRKLPMDAVTEGTNEDGARSEKSNGGTSEKSNGGKVEFKDGEKIEANYKGKGKWHVGKIAKVRKDGFYDIHYEDGQKEEKVNAQHIRHLPDFNDPAEEGGGKKGSQPEKKGSQPELSERDRKKKEKEDKEAKLRSLLKVDTAVEGNYKDKGKWYPGKIAKIRSDGTYLIAYDDGEEENFVFVECIRFPEGSAEAKALESGSETDQAATSDTAKTTAMLAIGKAVKTAAASVSSDAKGVKHDGDEASKFAVGDQVEADYKEKGKWYSGKITQVKAGGAAFDIEYDDGEKEMSVPADRIRFKHDSDEASKFIKDDKVEVDYKGKGKWYSGTITLVKAGGAAFDIVYDDGEKEMSVPADRIRFKDEEAALKKAAEPEKPKEKAAKHEEEDDAPKFVKDDKIEADYKGKGKWYPGKVGAVKSDGAAFDILYDDGEKELSVPASRLRYKEGEAPKKAAPASPTKGATKAAAAAEEDEHEKPKAKESAKEKAVKHEEEEDVPKFAKDDKIEADYKGKGKWYPGKVGAVKSDGAAFDILYDDGEKELSVPASRLRYKEGEAPKKAAAAAPASPTKGATKAEPSSDFHVNDKVTVDYKGKGKFYLGKISKDKGNGIYDILYDDGEKETDVPAVRIKIVGDDAKKPKIDTTSAADEEFDHDHDSSAATPRRPQQEKPSSTSTRAAQAASPTKASSKDPPADAKKLAAAAAAEPTNNKKKSPAAAADEMSKFLRESGGMASAAAKKTADAAVARDITTLSQLQSTLKSRNFAFETLHLTKSVAERIVAAIGK